MDQQEEGSPIFLVPEVILEEKIFARCGNLKELSLTCQYFHDIISKSRLLMKRFQLKIEKGGGFLQPPSHFHDPRFQETVLSH
jgi:hypothetical protein